MRRSWLISAVLVSATSIACTALLGDYNAHGTATVNSEGGTSGGPGGCTDTEKTCNGTCVSKTDPNAGCATAVCTPCAATTNAAPACKAGGCSFTCNAGFDDCDGNPANGCEGKTSSDAANCGKCGDPCGATNTTAAALCMAGKCAFTCNMGFAHCSSTNATGCETSTEKDPLNCGACGHSCLGGACTNGTCEPFQLASTSQPSGLAVDKTHVYFTAPSHGTIDRVQRDGKCMPASPCPQSFVGAGAGDLLTGQTRGPTAIVSDGTDVYWTANAAGIVVKRSATLPPGAITTLGPGVSTNPGYLALGAGKVWWTSGFGTVDPAAHVRNVNVDGTGLATVANYQSPVSTFRGTGGIATDATTLYWASQNGNVYHAAFADPLCTEGSVGAGPFCKAYGSASSGYGVTVDDTFVYWTEPSSGTIKRAPKAGGQASFIATSQDLPQAIAVMGTFVYWGNASNGGATGGTIRRAHLNDAPCDGVACEKIAGVGAPDSIIAADDGIYWVNNDVNGGVFRLAK